MLWHILQIENPLIPNSDRSLTVTVQTARHNEITNNINRVKI